MCDRLCGEAAPQDPVPDADGGPGIRGFLLQPRTSPVVSAGKGSRLRLKRSREPPGCEAAGCRGEQEECDAGPSSRGTSPSSGEDVTEGHNDGFFSVKNIVSVNKLLK